MKLFELFESAETDVTESMWAEITRRALIDRVKHDPRFRTSVSGLKTNNAMVDHIIQFLTIKFVAGGNGGGEYFHGRNGYGGVIQCEMKTKEITRENVLEFLSSRMGASTFRHEFQHFLDFNYEDSKMPADKYDRDKVQMGDKDEMTSYVNSEAEFSAFLKELAEPLLAILRAAKEGDYDVLASASIEPDFRKFIRGQHYMASTGLWGILDHMDDHKRVRLLKRLAALHKAATAISGVSLQHNPAMIDRVLMWLGKTLKTLGVGKDKAWGKNY